jgi:hypothetical protein
MRDVDLTSPGYTPSRAQDRTGLWRDFRSTAKCKMGLYPNCVRSVSGVCQGCVGGMSVACQRCVRGVSGVCQEYLGVCTGRRGVQGVCAAWYERCASCTPRILSMQRHVSIALKADH